MKPAVFLTLTAAVSIAAAGTVAPGAIDGQTPQAQVAAPAIAPTNDAPNPYQTIEGWAKMPAGGTRDQRRW